MSRYAEQTEVPVERSRAEIERSLTRYGATGFVYGWTDQRALVQFSMRDRAVRFLLPLPDRNADEFTKRTVNQSGARKTRPADEAERVWERACRQRWRALALVIKAKLEAVESGIVTFDEEFLAQIVLPDDSTVGAWAIPQVAEAYQRGIMPPALPALERPA